MQGKKTTNVNRTCSCPTADVLGSASFWASSSSFPLDLFPLPLAGCVLGLLSETSSTCSASLSAAAASDAFPRCLLEVVLASQKQQYHI